MFRGLLWGGATPGSACFGRMESRSQILYNSGNGAHVSVIERGSVSNSGALP